MRPFVVSMSMIPCDFLMRLLMSEMRGKNTGRAAAAKADGEYAEYNKTQHIVSDFDRAVKKLGQKNSAGDGYQ